MVKKDGLYELRIVGMGAGMLFTAAKHLLTLESQRPVIMCLSNEEKELLKSCRQMLEKASQEAQDWLEGGEE